MNYQQALEAAIEAARRAGRMLLQEFQRPGGPRGEGSHAVIDAEAEALIRDHVTGVLPEFGIRGEELPERDRDPQDPDQHVWLIDPNDGTSSFLKGYRGSAVSIGLLRQGIPVLGVIFAFAAPHDQGDLFSWAEGCGPLRRNGQPIQRNWAEKLTKAQVIVTSQAADRASRANAEVVYPARFRAVPGIAYRLALVAVGEGEVAVSLNAPRDWDFAAGHALLRSVGGDIFDAFGQPITYSPTGIRPRGGRCFGGSRPLMNTIWPRDWESVLVRRAIEVETYDLVQPQKNLIFVDPDPGVLARAQGCLLGQLAGDALGSQVEFESPESIQHQYPDGVQTIGVGRVWNTLAGQPTDDSELALVLARSLIQTGRFEDRSVAQAYVYWYRSQPFDIGGTTRQAFSALDRAIDAGIDPIAAVEQAANLNSQANGALMRISPLGIFGYGVPESILADWARADARLSHPHPVCQDASTVLVIAIRRALNTGDRPDQIYSYVQTWAKSHSIHADIQTCLEAARHAKPIDYSDHMGWVRIALHNAFYQLLHAADVRQGLIDTVMQGGDTDTNAAIAGALLGSVYGYAGIPDPWRDRVLTCRPIAGLSGVAKPRPRSFWPVDALIVAEQLLVVGSSAK